MSRRRVFLSFCVLLFCAFLAGRAAETVVAVDGEAKVVKDGEWLWEYVPNQLLVKFRSEAAGHSEAAEHLEETGRLEETGHPEASLNSGLPTSFMAVPEFDMVQPLDMVQPPILKDKNGWQSLDRLQPPTPILKDKNGWQSLERLNRRFRVRKIERVFREFAKHQRKMEGLRKKAPEQLTEQEKRLLQRGKRARVGGQVPAGAGAGQDLSFGAGGGAGPGGGAGGVSAGPGGGICGVKLSTI